MSKKTAYHHGDLRHVLLEASLALIDESGIGALSLREVARKAGVSHNAPYHHFKDRGSLLAALVEDGFTVLAEEMVAARAAASDARARLEACGLAYIRFALKSPARFKLMFRPELTGPDAEAAVAQSSTAALDTLTAAIIEAQAGGLAPAGDPKPLVLTCWAAVHGLASLLLDGPLARAHRAFATSPDKLTGVVPATLTALLTGAAAPKGPGRKYRGGSGGPGRDIFARAFASPNAVRRRKSAGPRDPSSWYPRLWQRQSRTARKEDRIDSADRSDEKHPTNDRRSCSTCWWPRRAPESVYARPHADAVLQHGGRITSSYRDAQPAGANSGDGQVVGFRRGAHTGRTTGTGPALAAGLGLAWIGGRRKNRISAKPAADLTETAADRRPPTKRSP